MTDQHSLPPLPEPHGRGLSYTISDTLMYGQACAAHARKAALEEAAKVCESDPYLNEPMDAAECAAQIRSLV